MGRSSYGHDITLNHVVYACRVHSFHFYRRLGVGRLYNICDYRGCDIIIDCSWYSRRVHNLSSQSGFALGQGPMRYRYQRSQVAYGQGLTSAPISRCDNRYRRSQVKGCLTLYDFPPEVPMRYCVPDPIGSQISRAYIFKSNFCLR